MTTNFVKFQRCLSSTFNTLLSTKKIEKNTLYFVYDAINSETGNLYLGDRLIATPCEKDIKLSDIQDLSLANAEAGDILMMNSDGIWIPVNPEFISAGGSFNNNQFESIEGQIGLNGFSEAAVGAIPYKTEDNKISWKIFQFEDLESLQGITESIMQIKNSLGDFSQLIPNSSGEVSQDIVSDLNYIHNELNNINQTNLIWEKF